VAITPPEAWERLARALIARRLDLDPKYKSREAFARDTGMDYRVLFDIEKARRTNFGPITITRLERAYKLQNGSIERFLADPDLTEFPDRIGSAAIEIAAPGQGGPPRLSAVPDIQLGRPGDPDPRDPVTGLDGLRDNDEVQLWTLTVFDWPIRAGLIKHLRHLEEDRRPPEQRRPGRRADNGTRG
jgi:hypothetical protein